MIDRPTFWLVVVVLGIGTYLIRLSFLGLLGNRPLPLWLVRSLRYTAVAVLPALVYLGDASFPLSMETLAPLVLVVIQAAV